ncbi:MAG: hypothetical protein SCARUB_00107 [Candidatus Scalindua rubra]|uniref:Uncharacterized protein n=1 Tax=Candidatus Scalindua rubra TaxID=1872076 RepID=A0A1E3XGS4_9BACT|nr:MAG: hypothetical protein SCARUB_00107 [Candidatus Scalindua rubra]
MLSDFSLLFFTMDFFTCPTTSFRRGGVSRQPEQTYFTFAFLIIISLLSNNSKEESKESKTLYLIIYEINSYKQTTLIETEINSMLSPITQNNNYPLRYKGEGNHALLLFI